jgi:hypothetical protein
MGGNQNDTGIPPPQHRSTPTKGYATMNTIGCANLMLQAHRTLSGNLQDVSSLLRLDVIWEYPHITQRISFPSTSQPSATFPRSSSPSLFLYPSVSLYGFFLGPR